MERSYNRGYTAAPSDAHEPASMSTEYGPFDGHDELHDAETAGSPNANGSKKRKITRTRPLRSCVSCNRRKIKCDRLENGTGGCTPCIKRGEGDSCSLTTGVNHPFQSTASILYRIDRLEARLEELEGGKGSRSVQPKTEDGTSLDDPDAHRPFDESEAYPEYIRAQPQKLRESAKNSPLALDAPESVAHADKDASAGADSSTLPCETEQAAQVLENMYASRAVKRQTAYPTPPTAGVPGLSAEDRSQSSTIVIGPHLRADTHAARRSQEIRLRILQSRSFPSRKLADHLIDTYFASLDIYWHVHINYLFDQEYAAFWTMTEAGRQADVDPAWIAVLLLTLALGLQVSQVPLPTHCLPDPSMSPEAALQMSESWVDDAEELLKAADWSRRPQFRTLQAITLLCGYQTLNEFREGSGVTWIGAAIRLAQQMGLHLLDDGCKMPDDDPALPTGSNHAKLQFGRRTWLGLLVLEGVYALRLGRNLPLASAGSTSLLPANVDDIDLQTKGSLKEKPSWMATNATSLLHRWILNKAHRDLMELPESMPTSEKYTHVLALDAELRKWISDAPTAHDHRSDAGTYQSAVWRQWSTVSELHGQLMHIHRPYMVRGYNNEQYAYSVRVCLESAKVVCEARQHLKESIVDERFWWSSMRWLTAAIVIFIDLYQAIDAGYDDDVLETKKAEIPGIYQILEARQNSLYPTTRLFAYSATKVIDNLLDAEKVKRTAATTRRSSLTGAAKDVEPVGATFQRIAKHLASVESPRGRPRSRTEGGPGPLQPQRGGSAAPVVGSEGSSGEQYSQLPHKRKQGPSSIASVEYSSQSQSASYAPRVPQRSGSVASLQKPTGSPAQRRHTPTLHLPTLLPPHSIQPHYVMQQSNVVEQQPAMAAQEAMLTEQAELKPQISFGPAPISWDTAAMFESDPSALLHSMGYSYPASVSGTNGHISPDIPGPPQGMAIEVSRPWEFPPQNRVASMQSPDVPMYAGQAEHHGAQPSWYGYQATQPVSHSLPHQQHHR